MKMVGERLLKGLVLKLCIGISTLFVGLSAQAEVYVDQNKRGSLIIVGGGDTPYAVQKHFIELAGGPGRARIAIFPMATTEYDEEAEEVLSEFRMLGAESVIMNIDREQAQSRELDTVLGGFTGYWFLGGDQNLLASSLLGTRALWTIERRYELGAVVGVLS